MALLSIALAAAACAPWNQIAAGAFAAGVASELERRNEAGAPVPRPSLREIFRDGRYVFRPADRAVERGFAEALRREPLFDEATEKWVVRIAARRRGGSPPVYVMAAVLSDVAVRDPETWEGVLHGFAEASGKELETGTVSGTEIAYAKVRGGRVLMVDYARDLVLTVAATRHTGRAEMERLVRYLLRAGA